MSDDSAFFDELRDRYVVEREIGRGGMATVYLATEVRHRRPVALKVLRGERAAELAPERFLREIETAARLQHPHILPVFDSGESAGQLWFTMPYVDGESLRERLSRTPPLSIAEAVRIAREAAQALEHAHRQGVVHRDIKPENILLTRDGSTLVADFGIARSAEGGDRITTAGTVMGTPSYMSPEQAGAETEVDGRSDIYSLGCVLYEMVAGRPPFTGATPHAVVARHMTEAPAPLRTAGRQVPPPLERAILQAMAKTPGDRFDSAAEFASALERPGVVGSARARARPMTIALAAIALVAAIASGSLLLRRRDAAVRAPGGTVASGFDRKLTQLTTGAGVEEWPAWSPDGTRLAYVAEVDGFRQLFVRTLASGEERRVTHGPRDDIQPAWSPDGGRLVFVRATADSGKLAPGDLNGWYFEGGDVWSVDLGSGREAPLVSNAFGPAWSPDGARLAFDAAWAGPRRIWISDGTGRNPRQLTSDSSEAVIHAGPRWSPDGRRLVFRRIEKTDSDIMTAEVASDATTRVTHDASTDQDPAWSPDGRWIYFASNRGGGINVWRIAVGSSGQAGGAPRQLTTGAGDDVEPAPAPDGHRLAFAVRGLNADLWQLPVSPETGAATGPPTPVVVSTREESRGAWSPDGRMIAFNWDRQGEMNIWLHDLGSGANRQLTSGPGGDYQPSWALGRSDAGVLLRARRQQRHLGGLGGRWSPAPADRGSGHGHQSVLLAGRALDRIHVRPAGPNGRLGHERGRLRATATDVDGRRRALSPLDEGWPRHRLPRGDGDRAPYHAGRPRGRRTDAAAGGVERRPHVLVTRRVDPHGRARPPDPLGLSRGRDRAAARVRVRGCGRADRLSGLVARRPAGAVRPRRAAWRRPLAARRDRVTVQRGQRVSE